MEDWQGCLDPQCQAALLRARDNVSGRGGAAITAEDFLLALLDTDPSITRYLRGCGVDLDELTRTIQCEQPIVTEVGGEGLLSSQLIYWLASAREVCARTWLSWPHLLGTLARHADRLEGKAYVSLLEQVPNWPELAESKPSRDIEIERRVPLAITDPEWIELADDVAVTVMACSGALVWIRGPRGAGKSCWLQYLLPLLEHDYVEIDLRQEAELMASDLPVVPAAETGNGEKDCAASWPLLVLDNVSPVDLLALMDTPGRVASELLAGWSGPVLLLGPEGPDDATAVEATERRLGRCLDVFDLPSPSETQRRAILTAHQAVIEKQWNIHLPNAVIDYVASGRSRCVTTPGGMLEWVGRAAARLSLFARRGPAEAAALAGQADTLRRQGLVAMARQESVEELEQSLRELELQQAAAEVIWRERKADGTLHRLSEEDMRHELEQWVAARPGPVHYVLHCDQQHGDSVSAGSGNLHS
ncbi:hypothetical protein MD273_17625 [Marinobacter pelagius]|uniref:Clp protease N-terminal domain-containing protein n=1 Tax=Marinobacter sp. C7 TaxID=2951363 RepID=UPI001EF0803F|nr:Clp protease N-terminal domain-containing protein [Marinobacter sp. C7]MCG7201561.1 hypothetical protein [Marinobacter sp. C7]